MKTKPLLIIIFTLIAGGGLVFFLIRPVVSSILSSWQALSQAKENLKIIDEKKQALDALQNNKNLSQVAEIAQKYIPEGEEVGQLVIELSALAEQNNLALEETTLAKPKEAPKEQETPTPAAKNPSPSPQTSSPSSTTGGAKTVDFTMKLSGSFADFMNFLKALETSSRLISLKSISLQSKTDPKQPGVFSAQVAITGSAFYKDKITLEKNLENIKVSDETLEKFLNLKTYGQPINLPGESGFGRSNPFENY